MSSPRSQGIPSSPRPASPGGHKAKVSRTDYRRTTVDFAHDLELLKSCFRAYNRLAARVYSVPHRISMGGTEVGRDELRSHLSAICANVDRLGKYFRASASKASKNPHGKTDAKTRTGSQLKSLFYVSDQLAHFILEANKGNGLTALVGGNTFKVSAKETKGVDDAAHKVALTQIADWTRRLTAAGYAPGTEAYNGLCRANGADPAMRAAISGAFDALGGLQQVDQYQGSLGYSIDHADVNVSLQSLLAANIANSGMLVACLHLIARVNQLQSQSNGQRVHYDAVWEKYFLGRNSHYVIGGSDITQALRQALPQDPVALEEYLKKLTDNNATHLKNLKEHLAHADKSVFQRIAERGAESPGGVGRIKFERKKGDVYLETYIQRGAEQQGTDNWGILYAMFMVIISINHIPNYLLSEAQRGAIKSVVTDDGVEHNPLVTDAERLRQYITGLLNVHGEIYEPIRKAKLTAANKASNEAKKAAKAARTAAPAPSSPTRRVGFQ